MKDKQITWGHFLEHLRSQEEPFVLRRNGAPPEWSDRALHQSAYEQNPEFYALLAVPEQVLSVQRERILFQLLQASRAGMSREKRNILDRVVRFLLTTLHPKQVLKVFLALRRVRANHKHTAKAILQYILNHSELADMARCRRPALLDSLEHAMGKNVARACAKMLSASAVSALEPKDETYLRRNLLRFAGDATSVRSIFPYLYRQKIAEPETVSEASEKMLVSAEQKAEQLQAEAELEPKTVTATNRGDISATLIHLYRGGTSGELQDALENYVREAASQMPKFNGKLAVVLDASASTRGYGQREYCCISQSVALKLVLEKCCDRLEVYSAGGSEQIPIPEGNTDLATALLDAVESQPDLVAIVSDGYENVYPGDLARVAATLPQLGIETPTVFCNSKFTKNDDLSLRRAAPNLPELEFWHQSNFEGVLLSLFAMADPQKSEPGLRQFLLKKLDAVCA